ncbi:DUF1493 family protein [Sphingosinicella terrae]|uniref:DUF1493 family protein n=1 Tax=Sphingosinicella terrae TaxID=2172047 RepID=UPI000E0D9291|nr:DUF1493 family protein [Sphingosinicella terrae]
MKVSACDLDEMEVLERVKQAVREISGCPPEQITPEARLWEDLGIYGDDGIDLLEQLDSQFVMDWEGLDAGVHFGMEAIGPPLPPWHVKRSPVWFEPHPLRVAELAQALRAGRWPGSRHETASLWRRGNVLLASWILFVFLAAGVLVTFGAMINGLLAKG